MCVYVGFINEKFSHYAWTNNVKLLTEIFIFWYYFFTIMTEIVQCMLVIAVDVCLWNKDYRSYSHRCSLQTW